MSKLWYFRPNHRPKQFMKHLLAKPDFAPTFGTILGHGHSYQDTIFYIVTAKQIFQQQLDVMICSLHDYSYFFVFLQGLPVLFFGSGDSIIFSLDPFLVFSNLKVFSSGNMTFSLEDFGIIFSKVITFWYFFKVFKVISSGHPNSTTPTKVTSRPSPKGRFGLLRCVQDPSSQSPRWPLRKNLAALVAAFWAPKTRKKMVERNCFFTVLLFWFAYFLWI